MRYILAIVIFILLFVGIFWGLIRSTPPLVAEARYTHEFILNTDFDQVRKIMVRTNSLEKLIEFKHGEVLENNFDNLNLSFDKILDPNWQIEGSGYFVANFQDEDVGKQKMRFNTDVRVTKDSLHSQDALANPTAGVVEHENDLYMERHGTGTLVRLSIRLKFAKRIPKRYEHILQERVNSSAQKELASTENGVRTLIDLYRNKRFILPLKN